DSELEQTQSAMTLMSLENLTAASAALSVPEAQCKLALSSAITEFDNGNPSKALPLLRKARADFTEAEASAVWDFLKGVSSQYAKAKLQGNQDLSLASEKLSLANQLYSEGKYSEAQLEAARAQAAIESAKTESDAFGASISQLALQMQANYSAFHPQVESQISEYSKQYSSLSASEKQRLPFTPAVAQAKLDESDKGLAASKKTTLTPQESLSQANSSFQSLLRLSQSLNSTLQSLDESARSSLSTAKAALSEAKAKFGSTFDISQAEAEISRADDFLQSGLFADSMASSDRATRALTAVLQSGTGAPDPKALLIGALSIAFIIGAAYFFMRARKKEEKKEKKEIPKADEIQGA
ncbi:MAG: hypothetical protein NT051_05695, partial [Candidatus Micrarchaeota archaeon]|nr:hypothetical protein [Candidatus Micrarchaeota archaeon]